MKEVTKIPEYKVDLEFERKLAETRLIVKATNFETFSFWEQHHKDISWVQEMGYTEIIGYLAGKPVNLQICWEIIDDKRVLFWDIVSQVSDTEMARQYFYKKLPTIEQTDTWNFWARLNSLK